ncbi:MAG: VCBS repeat-containing protein [Flavobacteriales bacterium]|nr:VCBS repeat-containing protein [Flavobacteriales bacterium]
MKRLFILPLPILATLAAAAQNTCATALAIAAGTHSILAVDGTQIPIPICTATGTGATNGEWFTYTPSANYNLTITTDLPQNTNDDTRFHVYTGVCGNLTCLSGNDDIGGGNNLSSASFNVQQGITYILAFDDIWTNGAFDFLLTEGPPVTLPVGFTTQPFSSGGYNGCVLDMNNDQLDDIVGANAGSITIHHQQSGGGFSPTAIAVPGVMNGPDWSIAAGDFDNNGQNDLLYGGSSGVTFAKANANGTAFTAVNYPQYVFSQRTNFVDMNNDGHLDAFVCHDIDANVYYMNNGAGTLTYNQGGLGDWGGNYGSIWIDYDNDHDMDMFIAKCGSDPIDQLHRNNGNGTFTQVGPAFNLADQGQSWSAAWGDYDNDGDMDVMSGDGAGQLGHRLMRNDGNTFTDVSAGSGFDLQPGSGIEYTTHDFNNDGWLDVLFPSGKVLVSNGNMTFTAVTANVTEGAVGDLNNDGYLDVQGWSAIHMNNGGTNHYVRVNTVGTVSNRNGIGARVVCTSALGTQIRDVKSGDAFSTMSSLMTHFGLGVDTAVDEIVVYWPSGVVNTVSNPTIDGVLTIVEDPLTSVADAGAGYTIGIWPVPAADIITLDADVDWANSTLRVLDIIGKEVMTSALTSNQLDVSQLSTGAYTLVVSTQSDRFIGKFTKQ